jgi:hypothetical protein
MKIKHQESKIWRPTMSPKLFTPVRVWGLGCSVHLNTAVRQRARPSIPPSRRSLLPTSPPGAPAWHPASAAGSSAAQAGATRGGRAAPAPGSPSPPAEPWCHTSHEVRNNLGTIYHTRSETTLVPYITRGQKQPWCHISHEVRNNLDWSMYTRSMMYTRSDDECWRLTAPRLT